MTTNSTTQPTDAATPNAPATKPAKKPVAKKQARKPAKASKKPTGDVNKSDEIRKVATASGMVKGGGQSPEVDRITVQKEHEYGQAWSGLHNEKKCDILRGIPRS